MQGGNRIVSPGSISNNWRNTRSNDVQFQQTQQQILAQSQQQQMYNQMQATLQALNMQTMEMQERLMASISQTTQQAQNMYERTEQDSEAMRQRRAALSNLGRAQGSRGASPETDSPPARPNRLSWNGAEGFLEQAVARRTAQSPPEQHQQQPNFMRSHVRAASSTSSHESVMLSDAHKRVISPSTGLTLVLSNPGDAFPSPTVIRPNKRLVVSTDVAARHSGSDSSNSSPRTPQSENTSESYSFESTTTAALDEVEKMGTPPSAPRLNPSAAVFTPPSVLAASRALSGGSPVAKPIRQPKGPCMDEQLPSMNFAGRVRARAFNNMRSKLRATSPVQAVFPISL